MKIKIIRAVSRATKQALASNFTGSVFQDEIIVGELPSKLRAFRVTFAPGGSTAWHTHTIGQTLHVLSGVGRIGWEGEPPRIIQPGDTIVIPAGVQHWHGADSNHLHVHLALSEKNEQGEGTVWMEHVPEADYAKEAVFPD